MIGTNIGNVRPVKIEDELRTAYLDYAMSVIVARALPSVRDGLKPVQRRILYAMHDMGMRPNSPYRKSARLVGEVLGKYHPHGDAPVYEAMVRMAQDFSMRYPLADGQGNFGSIDNDPPAAMRYTEARLANIAEEMLADIDRNTVDFSPNFDESLEEPQVLPARLPNLLINGATGIAVGMATSIPPHNLTEVCEAIIYLIDHPDLRNLSARTAAELVEAEKTAKTAARAAVRTGRAARRDPSDKSAQVAADQAQAMAEETQAIAEAAAEAARGAGDKVVDKLIEFVQGPDFPTGGMIMAGPDRGAVREAYRGGTGRIVMQSRAEVVEVRRSNRSQIVVTEIPFQVNKASLVEKIAQLARDKKIDGISDVRDESDRQGMRVVIELRSTAQPQIVLNNLYKHTAMRTTFSVNMLALVEGEPRVLGLRDILDHYIDFRMQVVTRRSEFDLEKAQARAHILTGLRIAIGSLDEAIHIIRSSSDLDEARQALIGHFQLTHIQATAILDMQLRRLTTLDQQRLEDEYQELQSTIAKLETRLADPAKLMAVVRKETVKLKTESGDPRRTEVLEDIPEEFTREALEPNADMVVTLSSGGYIKRIPASTYRPQHRGGKGVVGMSTREDDYVGHMLVADTHDTLLFFTNRGRVYSIKCYRLPQDASRTTRGTLLPNLISISGDERVTSVVPVSDLRRQISLLLATRKGLVKRMPLPALAAIRSTGIIAMSLRPEDELVSARAAGPTDEAIMVTERGQSLRFPVSELREASRTAGGVWAIRPRPGDLLVALDVVRPGACLLTVTQNGFGKLTELGRFRTQGRGGTGIKACRMSQKAGLLAAAQVVEGSPELIVATANAQVNRAPLGEVPIHGRDSGGVIIMRLDEGDRVISVAAMVPRPDLTQAPINPLKDVNPEVAQVGPVAEETQEGSTEDTEDTGDARVAEQDE